MNRLEENLLTEQRSLLSAEIVCKMMKVTAGNYLCFEKNVPAMFSFSIREIVQGLQLTISSENRNILLASHWSIAVILSSHWSDQLCHWSLQSCCVPGSLDQKFVPSLIISN